MLHPKLLLLFFFITIGCISFGYGQSDLETNFKTPPERAKPRTWMHAMSGNMSKAGMTKDLEAIKRVGIGGVLLFNVTHSIPNGNVIFNSDAHQDIIKHAAAECERLGLSFGVHNSDGWTSSGGPWVTPENSMKMLVWSDQVVQGEKKVAIQLAQPTARNGFYRDVAVVAYPALASEVMDAQQKPTITSSDPDFNVALAQDGRWDLETTLHASEEKKGWLQFDFGKPFPARSLYLSLNKTISGSRKATLLISDDGQVFAEAKEFNLVRLGKREFALEETFAPITARYFRIEIEDTYDLMEVSLTNRPTYDNYLARTSLNKIEDDRLKPLTKTDSSLIIDKTKIIDLTDKMDGQGNLSATLPKGDWTILRFGFTTTAAVNGPASKEGQGLEIDKMSKKALEIHYDAYVGKVVENTRAIAPSALQYLEIDSFEVGGQNWTDDYEKKFKAAMGYDLLPFLPIYTGRIIKSPAATDAVLWNVRNLNSDLITENYFGHFTELTHRDGLISYIEPYSFNADFNELDAAGKTDIPMGEFWMHQRYQTGTASSGAHIYGKNIVSAESFSAQPQINWKGHPGFSKTTGDKAWILGINEFMFHRFAHQANTHVVPGMTMSMWGSHIDRTQTWWDNAGAAWFNYIARGSYLLRQGAPVADLLVYVGEGSPSSVTSRNTFKPAIPESINYDNVNTDVLLNRIKVVNGKMVLPEGTTYQALALHNTDKITLKTLKRLAELSAEGVIIIGKKPMQLAGYNASAKNKQEFDGLVAQIWSHSKTYTTFEWDSIFMENNIIRDVYDPTKKDLTYIHRSTSTEEIYFFGNADSTALKLDLYFRVKDRIPELWDPMTGKIKRLAHFTTDSLGTRVPLVLDELQSAFIVFQKPLQNKNTVKSYSTEDGGIATFYYNDAEIIEIEVGENGNYQVAFQDGKTHNVQVKNIPETFTLDREWNLNFQSAYGFEKEMRTKKLFDWKDSAEEEIKYFSGTTTYTTSFDLDTNYVKDDLRLLLDLGQVSIAAKVFLNGQELRTLWIAPFTIDITKAAQKGNNELKIEVTNTWVNRLIGDEAYPRTDDYNLRTPDGSYPTMPDWYMKNEPMPAGKRRTFAAYPFYEAGDPLMSSGLMGPAVLRISKLIDLNE